MRTVEAGPALEKIDKLSEGEQEGARALASYLVGQGVGMLKDTLSIRTVVQSFKEDFIATHERLEDISALEK